MLRISVDLCYSVFYLNLKWSMLWVTLTHIDLDLCFQGHINKKWMHNITHVNITIQPYFVLSYKHFAIHLRSTCNYGILLPFDQLSFILDFVSIRTEFQTMSIIMLILGILKYMYMSPCIELPENLLSKIHL